MNLKDLGGIGVILIPIILLLFFLPTQFGGNTHFLVILSGSMEPEYPVGGLAILKQTNITNIQIGDVIAFKPANNEDTQIFVTHRIVEITEEGFITKGDANEDIDMSIVKPQQVVGRAEFVIPYLGYGLMKLSNLLKTKFGFLLIILIPASVILLTELRKIILAFEVDKIMKGLENEIK